MTNPFGDSQKIFEDFQGIFGEMFGKASTGRGSDLSVPLKLTLHEAVHGCAREVNVQRTRSCPLCRGTGGLPGASFATCATCEGRGITTASPGAFKIQTECTACRGRRGRWNRPCDVCDGRGDTPDTPARVKVTVPPSVRPGQKLRLEGQGNPSREDAKGTSGKVPEAGDLYLAIDVDVPRGLTIEGDDLVAQVRLDAAKSKRGGTITVPWIDGSTRVVIPPSSAHGARIVKRGWGLLPLGTAFSPPIDDGSPYRSGDVGVRGDLVVVVSHGADLDTLLEAELAETPAIPPPTSRAPEVRALFVGLAIVTAAISYLLLSR